MRRIAILQLRMGIELDNGYAISVSVCLYNIHLSPSAGVGWVWGVGGVQALYPMLDA